MTKKQAEFKVGDVVNIIGQSDILLTISQIWTDARVNSDGTLWVRCYWFDINKQLQMRAIPANILKFANFAIL